MPKTVALSPEVNELAAQLRRRGVADVLDATDLTRSLYSADASLYRVVPQAVARPRTIDDTAAVLDAARAVGMPVTTRGAGTSCAGNAVGSGLILDTSRHLNAILDIDPGGAYGASRARRGAIGAADRSSPSWVAFRTRSVDTQPLHNRRNDRKQCLRPTRSGIRQDR